MVFFIELEKKTIKQLTSYGATKAKLRNQTEKKRKTEAFSI